VIGKRVALVVAASVFALFGPVASGQSSPEYVVVEAHIDAVQGPTNIYQLAADCSNNSTCQGAMQAISAATGYPVGEAVAVAGALDYGREDEGSHTMVSLPQGYSYCTARFNLTSIVPRDGARGSTLMLEGRQENGSAGVWVETWTPRQQIFDGRSWVEGNLTVVGVRNDLAAAAYPGHTPCYSVPNNRRIFFACRGRGCEGPVVDRGRTVSASDTGANERRE
jgi:hypothetical protein